MGERGVSRGVSWKVSNAENTIGLCAGVTSCCIGGTVPVVCCSAS